MHDQILITHEGYFIVQRFIISKLQRKKKSTTLAVECVAETSIGGALRPIWFLVVVLPAWLGFVVWPPWLVQMTGGGRRRRYGRTERLQLARAG